MRIFMERLSGHDAVLFAVSVRAELVEALRPFDKLRANGVCGLRV
jgi:hypothetical protein